MLPMPSRQEMLEYSVLSMLPGKENQIRTLSKKVVKQRLEHECYFCGDTFPPGVLMRIDALLVDEEFATLRSCSSCLALGPLWWEEDKLCVT